MKPIIDVEWGEKHARTNNAMEQTAAKKAVSRY
jgi:hypothetical protein